MTLLLITDYPAIRAALDTELDAEVLPDSTIDLSIYRQAAEDDVLALHPEAESETGDNLDRVKRAAIFFCAARLAPACIWIAWWRRCCARVTQSSKPFSVARQLRYKTSPSCALARCCSAGTSAAVWARPWPRFFKRRVRAS